MSKSCSTPNRSATVLTAAATLAALPKHQVIVTCNNDSITTTPSSSKAKNNKRKEESRDHVHDHDNTDKSSLSKISMINKDLNMRNATIDKLPPAAIVPVVTPFPAERPQQSSPECHRRSTNSSGSPEKPSTVTSRIVSSCSSSNYTTASDGVKQEVEEEVDTSPSSPSKSLPLFDLNKTTGERTRFPDMVSSR